MGFLPSHHGWLILFALGLYLGTGREVLQVGGVKAVREHQPHAAVGKFCSFFLGGSIRLRGGPLLPLYLVYPPGKTYPASAQNRCLDLLSLGHLFPDCQDFGPV